MELGSIARNIVENEEERRANGKAKDQEKK